jgi:hypothetical protein
LRPINLMRPSAVIITCTERFSPGARRLPGLNESPSTKTCVLSLEWFSKIAVR